MKNSVSLIGRVGKDPELRNLDSGKKVVTFSMATTEVWFDEQRNKKEKTEWHNCVAWGTKAETIAKYVHKGDMFAVEGKLQTRSWEKEGVKHYTTEILVTEFCLLPNGKRENNSDNRHDDYGSSSVSSNPNVAKEDDLPF